VTVCTTQVILTSDILGLFLFNFETHTGDSMYDTGDSMYDTGDSMYDTGDSMYDTGDSWYDLSGMFFSTPDRDNDRYTYTDCAGYNEGGWWFNACHYAFLNGPWSPGYWEWPWNPTVKNEAEVMGTTMMIRQH
ncbi:fibrinogen-like protein 1, partial [Saccostrea cucullata]|uniref:fibrinogen-like protein 1 n=1 Tax=Saccostrea cuccullata TaxID=36930 RepID=UPI002ED1D2CF